MGTHDWIDLANGFGLIAITVIAVVLGHRLSRHEKFQQKISDYGERIAKIEGKLGL